MGAVERIEAAIQKLEGMRVERGYVEFNGWLAEPNTGDTYRGQIESREDLVPITNDELFVTLHRTIDAQLAILRDTRSDLNVYGAGAKRNYAVYLADSILRDAPAPEITRLSGAWCLLLGYEILDPDGWDRSDFQRSWNEPITQAEFRRRARISTHRRVGDAS